MASVSSSTLIIFIASILVAASVAGTMTQGVQRLSGALSDRSVDVSNEIRTDVEIISDPGTPSSIYDNGTLTILVKNTGSQTLSADPAVVDLIVDGRYATSVSMTVVDGDTWAIGNIVRVEATGLNLDSNSDHRVVLIVHGDREVLQFRT